MRKLFTIVLLVVARISSAQTDGNGTPVFNSVSTGEDSLKDFRLISNYYTLKNNLETRASSVFIADTPSPQQVMHAALTLPSEFYIITRKQHVVRMILVVSNPERKFLIVDPATGNQQEFPCAVPGDLSRERAEEIVKMSPAPDTRIEGSILYFNKSKLNIIPDKTIKDAVLALIYREHLDQLPASDMILLSQKEMKAMILRESREGGKMDFFTRIRGKEYDGVQVKPGIFSTNLGMALYEWGRACFETGINTAEDALAVFAEFKGKQPDQREREYIRSGFEKALEK